MFGIWNYLFNYNSFEASLTALSYNFSQLSFIGSLNPQHLGFRRYNYTLELMRRGWHLFVTNYAPVRPTDSL